MSHSSRLWTLWARYAGENQASRDEWSSLIARWSEPHRHYHCARHLLLMLDLLVARGAHAETMLAAWYHDAIYDVRSTTNEADSAALAAASLTEIGLAPLVDRVRTLVLVTASHDAEDADEQAVLLIDADLAILGQSPPIYLRYVEGIRREYSHVPDDEFRDARSTILQGFLDRERLYRHSSFASLEPQARANITAELAVYRRSEGD